MNKLIYPYTFEQWRSHPSNKEKLKWCKKTGEKLDLELASKQLKLIF